MNIKIFFWIIYAWLYKIPKISKYYFKKYKIILIRDKSNAKIFIEIMLKEDT